jgi:anti-anti-sigma factor
MEIKVLTEKGKIPVTLLQVHGNIDSATYEAFQSKADEVIKGGARYVLVDLTNAPFVSSAGLRALHAIFMRLRSLSPDVSDEKMHTGINAGTYKSPHLKLLIPSKEAQTALSMGGFDMYIEIYKDLKTALSSF